MKRNTKIMMIWICALLTVVSCAPQEAQSPRGVVLMAVGDVTIKGTHGEKRPARIRDAVNEKDILTTGEGSFATVQIGAKSVIRIQEESTVKFASLFGKKQKNCELVLKSGEVLSKIQKLGKGENFGVRTRTVLASVRGTEFSVACRDMKATVAVRRGKVAVNTSIDSHEPMEKVIREEREQAVIEEGKAADVRVAVDAAEEAPGVSLREIRREEELTIQKVGIVEIIPGVEKKDAEDLEKAVEKLRGQEEKIDKEIKKAVEESRGKKSGEHGSPRTMEEIKKRYKRVDEITTYRGESIRGAIISRGDTYVVMTTKGRRRIKKDDIKNIKVVN